MFLVCTENMVKCGFISKEVAACCQNIDRLNEVNLTSEAQWRSRGWTKQQNTPEQIHWHNLSFPKDTNSYKRNKHNSYPGELR